MKAFMTCLAAVTWIGLLIFHMDALRRQLRAELIRQVDFDLAKGLHG